MTRIVIFKILLYCLLSWTTQEIIIYWGPDRIWEVSVQKTVKFVPKGKGNQLSLVKGKKNHDSNTKSCNNVTLPSWSSSITSHGCLDSYSRNLQSLFKGNRINPTSCFSGIFLQRKKLTSTVAQLTGHCNYLDSVADSRAPEIRSHIMNPEQLLVLLSSRSRREGIYRCWGRFLIKKKPPSSIS